MWLSDDCADKHLGHLICRVSEMTSPLLSSGIYFKLMWPEHRQYRQKKKYLELPLRISVVSQWHPHKQPMCVVPSAGSRGKLARKGKISSLGS